MQSDSKGTGHLVTKENTTTYSTVSQGGDIRLEHSLCLKCPFEKAHVSQKNNALTFKSTKYYFSKTSKLFSLASVRKIVNYNIWEYFYQRKKIHNYFHFLKHVPVLVHVSQY